MNSDEQDEIKRAIILDEPENLQKIWLNEPFFATKTIEYTTEYVNLQENLSSEEKETLQ